MTFTFKLLAILARAAMPPGQCGCLPCAHFPAEGVYVERQDDYVYVVALDEYRLPNLKVLTTYEYEAVIGTIPQLDDCSFHSSHVLPTTECPPLYTPDVLTIAEDNSPCRFDVASKPSPLATPMNATPTNIVPIDALSVAEDDSPCVALSIPRPPASPKRAAATPKKATKSPKVVSSAKISRSKLRQSFSRSKGAILQRKTSSSSVSLPGSASDTSVIVLKQSMLRAKTSEQDKRKIQYWAIMSVIYEVLVTKICTPWAAILQNLLFPDKSAATIENWFNNRHQNWGPIDPNPEIQNVVFDRVNAKAPGKVEQITMTMRLTALKWSTSWTDEEFVTFLKEEIIPNQDRIIEEYLHKADTIPGYENRQNFSKVVDAIGSEEEREYKFIPELNSTLLVTRRVPTAAAIPTFVFR